MHCVQGTFIGQVLPLNKLNGISVICYMTKIEDLERKMMDLEENQDYIIELLHEIIDISRNKGPMISPNLMNESKNLVNQSTWIPPDHPGISNSLPIIHSGNVPSK